MAESAKKTAGLHREERVRRGVRVFFQCSLAARPKHFLPHAEQSPGGVGSGDLSGGLLELDFGGVAEGVEGRSEIRD